MNSFIASIDKVTATFPEEESWHCAKVLRKKAGDNVRIIDGAGNFYDGVLEFVNEKKCVAKIVNGPIQQRSRNYILHIAIAAPKYTERLEWFVEKAVEVGVDELSLFISHNSERKKVRTDRLSRIIVSAVKQSMQARIPLINEPVSFDRLLSKVTEQQKLIAHCFEGDKTDVRTVKFGDRSNFFMIGPEGDFSREEVEEALAAGFTAVSLGENRLRTETAGLFVCQAAALLS